MKNESYPLKKFTDLGLAEPILRAVLAEGYTVPTPIQEKVIPVLLSGRDVVGIAQTGTGKTAAFVLPLLHKIADGQKPAAKSCSVLILAPTRELAAQIADSVRTYGKFMRHSVTVVVGGVKPGPQIRAMERGVDIVVATPGRLLDHMSTGAIRLNQATSVVLDEADQMLDLGFMPAIRRIMAKLPRERQTMLLSATMPKQIRSLATDFLNNPEEIAVAQVSKPIERINQRVILLERAAKGNQLVDILKGTNVERAIVFTRTKRGADKVSQHLQKAGLLAAAIHGNKSQNQRTRTLAEFKSSSVNILVATDIAARGIDVDDVSHVVNYELPNVPESYVHRIGRTARAGKSGHAVSFCDNTEQGLLRDIEKLIGISLDKEGKVSATDQDAPKTGRGRGGQAPRGNKGAKGGQARHGQAPKHRGKPTTAKAGAKPGNRKRMKPGNGAANAGLDRMLGNSSV